MTLIARPRDFPKALEKCLNFLIFFIGAKTTIFSIWTSKNPNLYLKSYISLNFFSRALKHINGTPNAKCKPFVVWGGVSHVDWRFQTPTFKSLKDNKNRFVFA